MKGRLTLGWATLVCVAMTACGVADAGNVNEASSTVREMSQESNTPEDEPGESIEIQNVSQQMVEEIEVQEPSIEPDVGFDEEFTLKPGEEICVGESHISMKLMELSWKEEWNRWHTSYQLTIDGKVYNGVVGWSSKGAGNVIQQEKTEHRVKLVGLNENESATYVLTAGTEEKPPLILSGSADDEYITTQPEYVISDEIILFLPENTKLYGNTMDLINDILDLVEKETGMSYKNDSKYFTTYSPGGEVSLYYGPDTFAGVDIERDMLCVCVMPEEEALPQARPKGIVIHPSDLEITAGHGDTIVHEMVHVVEKANGCYLGTTLVEGLATYMSSRITSKSQDIPFDFDAEATYSAYWEDITVENAESKYCEDYSHLWEHYLYGYRFVTFLYENYGEDVYRDILERTNEVSDVDLAENREKDMAPIIKEVTSQDVFVKFAQWLEQNQDRFDGK